jgi:hypothetical protein
VVEGVYTITEASAPSGRALWAAVTGEGDSGGGGCLACDKAG